MTERRRYTLEEAIEILTECDFLELSVEALREKAERDLEYHMRPQLKVVNTGNTEIIGDGKLQKRRWDIR